MSIAQRLILFVCISVLTLLGSMGVSLYQNIQIKKQQDFIGSTVFPSMQAFRDITEHVGEYRRLVTSFNRVAGTPEEKSLHVLEDMSATVKKLEDSFDAYEKIVPEGEEKNLLQKTRSLWKGYYLAATESIPLAQNHEMEALEQKRIVIRKTGAEFFKSMREQVSYTAKQQKAVQEAVDASLERAIVTSTILVSVASLLLAAMGWLLYRKTVPPLRSLSQLMVRAKEERNLTLRTPVSGHDEVATAMQSFNQFLADLCSDFALLARSSQALHAASNSLTTTAEHVAETACSQSASSSSIAAATEELTVSIQHVAARASDTRQESETSGQLALAGVNVITETVAEIEKVRETAQQTAVHMHELETRAASVDQVVSVIRALADQTNLLALNAAIEAARAGEHGRGFAVVADEVRKLAEHTTKSTGDIGRIIESILAGAGAAGASVQATVTAIEQGVARTEAASQTIRKINTHAQQAVGMVEEISEALAEQSSAAGAIARQVEQMTQMTEVTSAASTQTRDAADHLNHLARQMQDIFSRYHIGH